jgi:hypothetical protein
VSRGRRGLRDQPARLDLMAQAIRWMFLQAAALGQSLLAPHGCKSFVSGPAEEEPEEKLLLLRQGAAGAEALGWRSFFLLPTFPTALRLLVPPEEREELLEQLDRQELVQHSEHWFLQGAEAAGMWQMPNLQVRAAGDPQELVLTDLLREEDWAADLDPE